MSYAQTEDDKYSWLYDNGYTAGPVSEVMTWANPLIPQEEGVACSMAVTKRR